MRAGDEWDVSPGSPIELDRGRLGGDLDAFRRYRENAPAGPALPLREALSRLGPSEEPAVVFARVVDVVVPDLADGCDVELLEEGEALLRASAGCAHPTEGGELDGMVRLPVQGLGRGSHPSYAGVLTLWWTARVPSPAEIMTADLLVRHVTGLVDLERLKSAVGESDSRAAGSAVEAIATRPINMAVGVVMHQLDCDQDEAEEHLRDFAAEHDVGLSEAAAHVARHRHLPSLASTTRRHLHSVTADEDG